jgi:hypothetical protein
MATAPRTHVFPNDLGQNTYVRETGTNNNKDNDAFHFMIFSAVRLASDTEQFTSVRTIRNTDGSVVDIDDGVNSRIVDQYTLPRLSSQGTYRRVSDSNIILYMPDEVKVNYSADLQQIDQGLMRDYIQAEGVDLLGVGKESLSHLWQRSGDIAKSALLSVAGALSATEIFALQLGKRGSAYNPVSEQLFKNMKMRTFDYNFRLVPRNQNESRTIQNILKEFRFQMHPELAVNGKEFKFPSLFVITYWRSQGGKAVENVMLNKISSCYLEDMNVNYSGQKNQFNTFTDGQPVEIDLALKFRETVVHTKESINRGF